VIAERGCRLYLLLPGQHHPSATAPPARSATASPPGDPLQTRVEAGTPDGDLLWTGRRGRRMARVERRSSCHELGPGQPAVTGADAGRRRAAQVFRTYMALYAREQAFCHFSPALIANLERHWDARNRRL
jgi:hypothetical protein